MSKRYEDVLKVMGWLSLISMLAALYSIFIYVPTEEVMGVVQRIFYFHLPSAFIAFLAFFMVFISSIFYLWKKDYKWDLLAYSSAEIGVVFCTLVLVTGSIWAKPIWNTWWTWDPRLTTTLVLWFIYVAYLILRNAVGSEWQRARFAAVFGIVGFIDVPIVFMSIRWWRTIHPEVFKPQEVGLEPSMLNTLLLSLLAFTLLYFFLLAQRFALEKMKREVEGIKRNLKIY